MVVYCFFSAACIAYTFLYTVHCIKTKQKTAAAGGAMLFVAAAVSAIMILI